MAASRQKFQITDFMAEFSENSAIYLYALNRHEKYMLELALENIHKPYLWHDWAVAQDVLERIAVADIAPVLERIAVALETIAEQGTGGGVEQIEDELKWIKDIALVLGSPEPVEVVT